MRSSTGGVVPFGTAPAAFVGGGESNFGGVTCPPDEGASGGRAPDLPLFLAFGWRAFGGGAGGNANKGGGGGKASIGAGGRASKGARSFGKAK